MTQSGSHVPPSLPCTPTFDDRSPAVGRRCLSTTVRVGVTPTWTSSCQSTIALCRSASILAYSFERTGRTTALQPTRLYSESRIVYAAKLGEAAGAQHPT